jgi:Uma2 family endonuclease
MAVAELHRNTIAELLDSLGGIPAHRVLLRPTPGEATEEDVSAALVEPRKRICELIDGVLVEKAVGGRESLLASFLSRRMGEVVDRDGLGVILGEAGFFRLEGKQLRAPDVSFIPWSELGGEEIPEEAYWSVAPALAVEVLSRDNTVAEIDRKIVEFFAAGTKLFWVIDPSDRVARVYTSPKRFKLLYESGVLDGGKVLPGFKLPLADLFTATKRGKKKPR